MRLNKVSITGYGRLRDVSFRPHRKLTALLGPNEAGKSTVLRALRSLNNTRAIPNWQLTRDAEIGPDDVVISATFRLEKADLELISHLPLEVKPSMFRREKQAKGTLTSRIEPVPRYKSSVWTDAGDALAAALITTARADGDEEYLAPELATELDVRRASMEELATSLANQAVSLSRETWVGVLETLRQVAQVHPSFSEAEVDDLDERFEFLTKHPSASIAVEELLANQLPRFEMFTEADRALAHEYPLDGIQSNTPKALKNVLALAGVTLDQVIPSESDRTAIATAQDEGNDTLAHVFQAAWRQHQIAVKISFDPSNLILLVRDLGKGGKTIAFDERSDGLKLFVALTAFLATRSGDVPPILLIDEAETHLHWDAQADLVNVLASSSEVGQILYTTHSPGCLPPDLGTGLLFVQPNEVNPMQSLIRHDFWNVSTKESFGMAPLLYMMGAGAAAFSSLRRAVVGEGPSDMILLPSLIRAATNLDELDYQIVPGISVTSREELPKLDQAAVNVGYLVDGDLAGKEWRKQLISAGVEPTRIVSLSDGVGLEDLLERQFVVDTYLASIDRSERFADLPFADGPIKPQLEALCATWSVGALGATQLADALLDAISDSGRAPLASSASGELKRVHKELKAILRSVT